MNIVELGQGLDVKKVQNPWTRGWVNVMSSANMMKDHFIAVFKDFDV